MKQHNLYLSVRVRVESRLDGLSDTVQEFERATRAQFSDTENVGVLELEILKTKAFNPKQEKK